MKRECVGWFPTYNMIGNKEVIHLNFRFIICLVLLYVCVDFYPEKDVCEVYKYCIEIACHIWEIVKICVVCEMLLNRYYVNYKKGSLLGNVTKNTKNVVAKILRKDSMKDKVMTEVLGLNEEILQLGGIHYFGINKDIKISVTGIESFPRDSTFEAMLKRYRPELDYSDKLRVNCTANLMVRYLKKYNTKREARFLNDPVMRKRYKLAVRGYFKKHFYKNKVLKEKLINELKEWDNFENVKINKDSAVGYPLNQPNFKFKDFEVKPEGYRTKGECLELGKALARERFAKGLWNYKDDTYWNVAGRGKEREKSTMKNLSARLVQYQGFQNNLIGSKIFRPFSDAMKETMEGSASAIGFKWTDNGGKKLHDEFENQLGAGKKTFYSLDISGWDADIPAFCIEVLRMEFGTVIRHLVGKEIKPELLEKWIKTLDYLFQDLIHNKVLMPYGHVYQLHRGMKSGWCSTAPHNTLVHVGILILIREEIKIRFSRKSYAKGYGDDNIGALLGDINLDTLERFFIDFYDGFGFRVKPGSLEFGSTLMDISFLSKRIEKRGNYYVPVRPESETYTRLICPDTYRTFKSGGNLVLETTERVLGHYVDNFFHHRCRKTLRSILKELALRHGLEEITLSDRLKEKMTHVLGFSFDSIKSVPDNGKLCKLFGVPTEVLKNSDSRIFLEPTEKLLRKELVTEELAFVDEKTALSGSGIEHMVNTRSQQRDDTMSRQEIRDQKFRCRPFIPNIPFKGNAGGKVGEIIKRFVTGKVKNILDIGSHPGSAINAERMFYPESAIDGVSLFPKRDKTGRHRKQFCYKVTDRERTMLYEMDILDFSTERKYDLLVSDVGIGTENGELHRKRRSFVKEALSISFSAVDRFKATHNIVKLLGMDFNIKNRNTGENMKVCEALFKLYKKSSVFKLYKPKYSYPWNNEYYVYFKRGKNITKQKNYGQFKGMVDAFWNEVGRVKLEWQNLRDYCSSPDMINEAQQDMDLQLKVTKMTMPDKVFETLSSSGLFFTPNSLKFSEATEGFDTFTGEVALASSDLVISKKYVPNLERFLSVISRVGKRINNLVIFVGRTHLHTKVLKIVELGFKLESIQFVGKNRMFIKASKHFESHSTL